MSKATAVLATSLYLLGTLEAKIQEVVTVSAPSEAVITPRKGFKKKKAEITTIEEVLDVSFTAQAQSTIMTYLLKVRSLLGDLNMLMLQQQRPMTLLTLQANICFCDNHTDLFIKAAKDLKVQAVCQRVLDLLQEVFAVEELATIERLLRTY